MTSISSMYVNKVPVIELDDDPGETETTQKHTSLQSIASLDEPVEKRVTMDVAAIIRKLNALVRRGMESSGEMSTSSFEAKKAQIETNLSTKIENIDKQMSEQKKAQKMSFWAKVFGAIVTVIAVVAAAVSGPAAIGLLVAGMAAMAAMKGVDKLLEELGVDSGVRSLVKAISTVVIAIATAGAGIGMAMSKASKFAAKETAKGLAKGWTKEYAKAAAKEAAQEVSKATAQVASKVLYISQSVVQASQTGLDIGVAATQIKIAELVFEIDKLSALCTQFNLENERTIERSSNTIQKNADSLQQRNVLLTNLLTS